MRTLFILAALFALWNPVSALTWTSNSSGSISSGMSNNLYVVFPYSGTAVFAFICTYPQATVGGRLYRGTTLIDSRTPSTGGCTFGGVSVVAGVTYNLNSYCTAGSGNYVTVITLTYTPNSAPVITSMTASPSAPLYGQSVTVTVTATDADSNLSYVRFSKDGVNVDDNTSPFAQVYSGLGAGIHTVTAYAVDTQAASDDEVIQFTVSQRPISVMANSGTSLYGTAPTGQGLSLVSGSLVNGDTLASIGLSADTAITLGTPPGTYTIAVAGTPANYSVTGTSGTWTVVNAVNGYADSDNDVIPDNIEMRLFGNLTTVSSVNQLSVDADGDLFSRLVEALGGLSEGTFTTGTNWTTSNAPGSNLSGGPILVTSSGACLSVNTGTLVLTPYNW
jgi:hypothetical protein